MSFFTELKRRNVVRVAIAYIVVAWLTAQVLQLIFQSFGAPDWVMKTVLVLMAAGLLFALFFSWAFEVTPEGIKREKDVDRTQSITPRTGKKLDGLIITVLVLALGYFAFDKFVLDPGRDAQMVQEAITQTGSENHFQTDAESEGKLEPENGSLTPEQSIAVLPFVNMSDDKDYFADGLSEELLNLLAKIPDLKVAGRTSSFAFKGKNDDLRGIGDALGVANVLEGSVRRSGDRLRITAQLIKVEDGFHMWSETYDREMADVFDIQDEVASAITQALKLHLAPEADRLTDSPEAYALYLQALALAIVEIPADIFTGLELLGQAIAIDPTFAKAYELEAQFHWMSGGWVVDNPVAQVATFEAASKALELDPSLASARSFAATAKPDWNWPDEISALERLVTAQPNNVGALQSIFYSLQSTGYQNEALTYAERIIELDPLSSVGYWRAGSVFLALGKRTEAHSALEKAAELGNLSAMMNIGFDLLLRGDDEQAVPYLQEYSDVTGQPPESVGEFIRRVRDPENGKAYLDEFIEKSVSNAAGIYELMDAYFWYLGFGYMDDYFQVIELLSDGKIGWTNADVLEGLGMTYRNSGYVQHPKYLQRAAKDGSIDLWEQRGPPDHCKKTDGNWVCE